VAPRLCHEAFYSTRRLLWQLVVRYNIHMDEKEDGQEPQGVSVHMGFPNPAVDKSLLSLDLHQLLIRRPASTFMFRITGSDWAEVGIFDGDIAIIDRALDPRKSDLIIWWNDQTGEFAVSFFKQLPENAAIWGVVTRTIHRFRKDGA
jgi:SOS-response transcriptional repressor LexA